MQASYYWALVTFVAIILLVLLRTLQLKKQGIDAIEFGKKDKSDFILPPFALCYVYLLVANAFHLPTLPKQLLFHSTTLSHVGVFVCVLAVALFAWTLLSFKKSFRVGLAENTVQGLVTTGAFAISRNPIYVCFALMLLGQFLIYSAWLFLIFLLAGMVRFHKQVLKEEIFLKEQYKSVYDDYCRKVKRYL